MTSACLGNFGSYKLFYWQESKKEFDFEKAERRLKNEIELSQLNKQDVLDLSSENIDDEKKKQEDSSDSEKKDVVNDSSREIVWVRKRLDTRDPRHLVPTPREKLYTPRPWPEPRPFFVPPLSTPSLAKFTRAHEEIRPAASNPSTR